MAGWTKANTINKVQRWKELDETIVFTNGCFDLLHVGHVHILREAKKLGDRLIVGLNSDESVQRLKGAKRPINFENDRAFVLKNLSAVDGVVIFQEDTPLTLIKTLSPDILVKGGDYSEDDLVGAEFVKSMGGKVIIIPFLDGFSTTNLLHRIHNL
jgi:D-beta-D-heptose 7-phosphate kinase/D-beta-D-heptose 1-phosphate adenosyltransferase